MALKVTALPHPTDMRTDVMASPMEMDPSVLQFDRPGSATTSEPASRIGTQVDRGSATGAPPSPAFSPGGGVRGGDDEFAEQLSKATIGLAVPNAPAHPTSSTATVRARAATSPLQGGSPLATPTSTLPPAPKKSTTAAPIAAIDNTGVDSIFRLLPRETRPALMAMLSVEPTIRCTLADLLKGRGNDMLVCRCGGAECGGGMNTPPGTRSPNNELADGQEIDIGDDWLKSISCCSHPGGAHSAHAHVKIEAGSEEKTKKRFFG